MLWGWENSPGLEGDSGVLASSFNQLSRRAKMNVFTINFTSINGM